MPSAVSRVIFKFRFFLGKSHLRLLLYLLHLIDNLFFGANLEEPKSNRRRSNIDIETSKSLVTEIAGLEDDLKGFRLQLDTVQSSLQSDPDNTELQALQAEIEEAISTTESLLEELRPAVEAPSTQKKASPPPEKAKWSVENHPAYQSGNRKSGAPQSPTEESTAISYKVNDTVLAKWLTGDKAFYPARITSITGSAADPVYFVTFKSYGNTETLRGPDIKPIVDAKKRKADGSPVPPTTPPATTNSSVISAAASIDPDLANQAKKEPSKVGDGPSRPAKIPRKVKAKKELEAGKSKWQDFTAKGKMGKASKKESMFRTGEGVNARVGFTGSGQAMRKDPTRSRHVYQADDDDNY